MLVSVLINRQSKQASETKLMARKLESGSGLGLSAGAAPLRIMDWDEGAPQPSGWVGVEITYRQDGFEIEWEDTRSSLRVIMDPADANPKHQP